MKKVFILIVLATALLVVGTAEANAQAVRWQDMKDALFMAQDSALVNSNTKKSNKVLVFAKTGLQATSVNYLHGARILVLAKQANDSIRATVNILVGQVGGTAGTNFARIEIDSLHAAKKVLNIDLAPYLVYPEVQVEVVGKSSGNGFQAAWSALFGGVGKQTVER